MFWCRRKNRRQASRQLAEDSTPLRMNANFGRRADLSALRKLSMQIKPAYTTGEAARICNRSQTTIIRLFDTGVIKGYYVPNSKFRRIPHDELERFLVDHAFPNPFAKQEQRRPAGASATGGNGKATKSALAEANQGFSDSIGGLISPPVVMIRLQGRGRK